MQISRDHRHNGAALMHKLTSIASVQKARSLQALNSATRASPHHHETVSNDPFFASRQRHRIVLELDQDVIEQLARWSTSSGQCIEDIARQLLMASVRVMGDRPAWPVQPPDASPASPP